MLFPKFGPGLGRFYGPWDQGYGVRVPWAQVQTGQMILDKLFHPPRSQSSHPWNGCGLAHKWPRVLCGVSTH